MGQIYLRAVGRTDVGRVRAKNEDFFVVADLTEAVLPGVIGNRFEVGDRGVLLAVSDGVGGSQAGEVASHLVLETLTRALARTPPNAPADMSINIAVQKAHAVVRAVGQQGGIRMGATLTAVYVHGVSAFIVEVGDSRAYLVRAGKIMQLTRDQSFVQHLLDNGTFSAAEAESSPYRNLILQAMGHQKQPVRVALGRLELRARDCFVLCSDGLTRHVSDEEIRTAVLSSGDLETACISLVDLANARGGEDNITVVIGGVGGALPASTTTDMGDTYAILQTFE